MSIFFKRYCVVPRSLAPEMLGKLRDGASYRLYLFLCAEMERVQNPVLRIKNERIKRTTDLSLGSITAARKKLKLLRLIDFERGSGGVYTYFLLDEGELAQERSKPYRTFHDSRATGEKRAAKLKKTSDGADFPFGWNALVVDDGEHPNPSRSETAVEDVIQQIGHSFKG